MPVKLSCRCGKTFAVRSSSIEKRVQCPSCGRKARVPDPNRVRQGAAAGAGVGVDEGGGGSIPLAGLADLEKHSGGDLHAIELNEPAEAPSVPGRRSAGDERAAPAPKPAASRLDRLRQTRASVESSGGSKLPIGLIVKAAILVIALGGGYYGYTFVKKAGAASSVMLDLDQGDLPAAQAGLTKLIATASGPDRQFYQDWLQRVRLELEKNAGMTLDKGTMVRSQAVRLNTRHANLRHGGMTVRFELTNTSDAPITLDRGDFYTRGKLDIVRCPDDAAEVNVDGAVVEPGQTFEGLVVFRRVPQVPVEVQSGAGTDKFYNIIFNDGEHYTKVMLKF